MMLIWIAEGNSILRRELEKKKRKETEERSKEEARREKGEEWEKDAREEASTFIDLMKTIFITVAIGGQEEEERRSEWERIWRSKMMIQLLMMITFIAVSRSSLSPFFLSLSFLSLPLLSFFTLLSSSLSLPLLFQSFGFFSSCRLLQLLLFILVDINAVVAMLITMQRRPSWWMRKRRRADKEGGRSKERK